MSPRITALDYEEAKTLGVDEERAHAGQYVKKRPSKRASAHLLAHAIRVNVM